MQLQDNEMDRAPKRMKIQFKKRTKLRCKSMKIKSMSINYLHRLHHQHHHNLPHSC